MAYTSVKVIFEIGHEASVRAKKTTQGFTHDWELFIRGADSTEICHFIEKVAFHLHESFPNPKRVIKEPPFSIRESGYAGFTPIVEVYLRNKPPGEPSKIRFEYNLTLPAIDAPPYSNLVKETYIFNNPTEDFRRKLIKGGGVGVGANSTSHSSHMASLNSSHSVDDHKTSGSKNRPSTLDALKKSKKENPSKHEERLNQNDSFSIFGTPIIKKEIPYTTTSKSNSKPIADKASLPSDKQTHSSKSSKHNSSSHKDKDRDKEKEREKEKAAEKPKEREKEKSAAAAAAAAAAVKRRSKDGDSVVPVKKTKKDDKDKISKSSKEDTKMKPAYQEEKPKEKSVEKPSTAEKESSKVDKKDKEKKHNKDEKKVKSKEKHKTEKKESTVASDNYGEHKSAPTIKEEVVSVKEEKKTHKVDEKEEKSASKDKSLYNTDLVNTVSHSVASTFDAGPKKDDKHKHHKHKKEKSKKESKREKEEKKDKVKEAKSDSKERTPVQTELPTKSAPKPTESPKRAAAKKPLKTLFDELTDKSDSDLSSDDDMTVPQTLREPMDSSPEPAQPVVKADLSMYARQSDESTKEDKVDGGTNKRKNKKSEEKEAKKRKRKSKHRDESPASIKMTKFDDHRGADAGLKHNGLSDALQTSVSPVLDAKFTEAYISKLKVLQEKIMTLDDNSGLQRIVQVVAETGQYEITTKTFDFDLCSLDEKIVDRLLDFFTS